MEIVIAIAAKVVEYTVAPIGRQLGYLIFYRRNVEDLRIQVQRLEETKERVQRDVDAAKRNGEEIYIDVQNWLIKVNELIVEASKLFRHEGLATTGCYSTGSCPNVLSRHQVSRKSTELLLEATKIQQRGDFTSVSSNPPPLPLAATLVTKDFKALDSRTKTLTEIMEKLKDSTIQTIGVWGLGGVGKTTLAKQLAKEVEESKMFVTVVMATATVNPDVRRIQGELADQLGLIFEQETEMGRANRLWQRINQEKSILIIIDDIWGEFELQAIGVLLGDGHKGSKLLLTSRSYDVLKREMGIQVGFRLEVLEEDEAWSLLEEMAGDTVEDPNVQPIAMEVVKRCAGLPVLIATVAKALKDEELYAWKDALKQLERFDNEGVHEKVYSALELSYNHLKGQEMKSLFLLISLHGQPFVYKYDLLIISVGLGLFKNVETLEDARNRLDKLTKDLKASCLLIENHREWVQIHDLVRETGSSIAKKDQLFHIGLESESKGWPRKDTFENFRGLLLSVRHQSDLPERLECPLLQVFALRCQDHLKISYSFFEVMREVKVLCLYRMTLILSPPLVLHGLKSLLALYLYECTLEDIAIVGELSHLEFLSVRSCNLKQLPCEIGRLGRLKMLDLEGCNSLEVIPPRVISNLIGLEELNMERSFSNWEVEGCSNASVAELNELPRLRSLCVHIPYSETSSTNMNLSFFEKLQMFKIEIGRRSELRSIYDYIERSRYDEYSKMLTLEFCKLESQVRILVEKVDYLDLYEVKGVNNVFHDLNAKGFSRLKSLRVSKNDDTECIVNSKSLNHPILAFPNLNDMQLTNLNNLVHICHGPFTEESFCKLRDVTVSDCVRLKNVLSASMGRVIPQLAHLRVSSCKSMEEIVLLKREVENLDPMFVDIIEFTQLQTLVMWDVPALISFCSMEKTSSTSQGINCQSLFGHKVLFPMLDALEIGGIDNLRNVWDHQITSNSFSKLKRIRISGCAKLVTIFPYNLIRNFSSLEILKIENCNSVEEIFDLREQHDEITQANVVGISCHLKYFHLQGLPKLKHMWSGDSQKILRIFQDLQSVKVEKCENLNYIFPAYLVKCLLQLEELEIISCEVDEIVAKDEGSSEVIRFHFPQLKRIVIKSLPKLKSFYSGVIDTLECPMIRELRVSDVGNETLNFSFQVSDNQGDAQQLFSTRKLFLLAEKVIGPNLESLCLGGKTATILFLNDQFQNLLHNLEILQVFDCSSLRSMVRTAYSSASFQNLHTLGLESCGELINLVTFSTVKSTLVRLKKLAITNCGKIKEIISSTDHQGQDVEDDEVAFNRLESLTLCCLPNLKGFCLEKCTLKFPLLKQLSVVGCPELKAFTPGILIAPLVRGVGESKYVGNSQRWDGDLNNTIKQMFIDMQEKIRAKGCPRTIKHPLHEEHQLVLVRGHFGCDGCKECCRDWSYSCGICEFDLHLSCALEGSDKPINEAGNK
ncbi:Disease resistance protein [Quillaja saponaria]|uniref:Disease resistance protein n=1 Tax=Quillaja saponaria TaxID=32244 RepID=A0AAD7PNX1_QUISA|nr:Disease resistance protein [Quillaja saponaria]